MKIFVDADACPSIDKITFLAKQKKIPLLLYIDDSHNLENDYGKVIYLSKGFQSVDMAISSDIGKGDILITQDFGLATIALTKSAYALHPKGMIYDNDNIEQLLYERHLNAKLRKCNKHLNGPKKRTKEDEKNLLKSLEFLINKGEKNE